MRIALFSSLAKNTGCWLKLGYLARALSRCGEVVVYDPLPPMPLFLDFILSIPWNLVRVMGCRCDVLMGAKPFLHITLPFMLRKWLYRTWTVVDVDDLDWEYRKGFLRTLVRGMQTTCTRFLDMVTFHNDELRDPLAHAFRIEPTKLYCLKQGVDFGIFNRDGLKGSPRIDDLRRRYGIRTRDEVLVYSAHLNAASCLDGILEAVRRVRQQNTHVRLMVIGGGDRELNYRRLAAEMGMEDSILFTGYLKPEEVAVHLLLGDIALVYYDDSAANRYRCSMKLREMLGMGRIIVCNRTGETPLFSDYVVMSAPDPGAMAEAILDAIRRKPALAEVAERGAAYARAAFDWEKIGAEFLQEMGVRLGSRRGGLHRKHDGKDIA